MEMNSDKANKENINCNSGKSVIVNDNKAYYTITEPVLKEKNIFYKKLQEEIKKIRAGSVKQTGAYGIFTATHDLSKFTKAKIFRKGSVTDIFARFGLLGAEAGCSDAERCPREFSLKFFAEEGDWDILGSSTPVFFTHDLKKTTELFSIRNRDPKTNLKDPTQMWDFFGSNPESLHRLLILMSDRGTPRNYRFTNGYGGHTYAMINQKNEKVWVKFHFKTLGEIKTYTLEEAKLASAEDPDFACKDLVEAIQKKNFPKWKFYIQVMSKKQAKKCTFDPFDPTKVWPQKEYPLLEAGIFELNRLTENYEREVLGADFNIKNMIAGIGYSPDKMLQERLLYTPGATDKTAEVSKARMNDGQMPHPRFGALKTGGDNRSKGFSFNLKKLYQNEKNELSIERPSGSRSSLDKINSDSRYERDNYTQPRNLLKHVMDETDRANLVANMVDSMKHIKGPSKERIISRQLFHLFRMDEQFSLEIANGLGIEAMTLVRKNTVEKDS